MEFEKVQVFGVSVRDDKSKIGDCKGISNIKLGIVSLAVRGQGCQVKI